jgi:hypothetical protein
MSVPPLKPGPPFTHSRRLEARQGKGHKRGSDYYSSQEGSHKLDEYTYRLSTNYVSSQSKGSTLSSHNAGR